MSKSLGHKSHTIKFANIIFSIKSKLLRLLATRCYVSAQSLDDVLVAVVEVLAGALVLARSVARGHGM